MEENIPIVVSAVERSCAGGGFYADDFCVESSTLYEW